MSGYVLRMGLIAALLGLLSATTARGEVEFPISLPPDSLAQWYKPANQRQFWLHNMFSLRRELQAVEEYLDLGEPVLLAKWARRLAEHYRRIGEMVPEWERRLDTEAADRLTGAAEQANVAAVRANLDPIKESCRACHKEYRAVVALLYRAPDFSEKRIGRDGEDGGRSYVAAMKGLSRQVNRIKIAFEDARSRAALDALAELRAGLEQMRPSCRDCHRDNYPIERVLGEEPRRVLAELERSLQTEDSKGVGRNLGEAAVLICARCHRIHRVPYDIKAMLEN